MRRNLFTAGIGFSLLCCAPCAADPQPVQVPVSTEWSGYDGSWSPVNIRVGSPQQWVSLFPNTLGQETWVIGASGCDETVECISKRGGIFKANESSTWSSIGPYSLNFQPALGITGYADYGLDTVWIGDAISVPEQIVGIMNSTEFLLGSLGLGVIPSNFTSNNQATFLSSMVENQSAIPSHSYGYTAGAYYRLKGVPASLTLGGVDLNRFIPNDVSFDLASDFQPVVSINAISVSSSPLSTADTQPSWVQEPLTLLESSQAELFTIDSSTPFLWLPEQICDAFALALNLTYNDTLQLYLYGNGTGPDALADWNMTFTFSLADLPDSSNSVDITLPFAAFNHQLSFPFPALNNTFSSPAIDYFPLRRGSNNTQYTIGRVFLQEAYLAVDYERNNFSISQSRFANDAVSDVQLAAITRPANSIFGGPAESSTSVLSSGVKIGIGIGVAILILVVVGLAIFFYLRKKRRGGKDGHGSDTNKSSFFKRKAKGDLKAPVAEVTELLGDKRHPQEVPADKITTRFELVGSGPLEMPAEVPSSYYAIDKNRYGTTPAELEDRNSTLKNSVPAHLNRFSHSPSLPSYSSAQIERRSGSNVSPESTVFNGSGAGSGTISSGISGITPNDANPNNIPCTNSYGPRTGSSNTQPVSPPEPSPLMAPTHRDRPENGSNLSLPRPQMQERVSPHRSVSRSSRSREEGRIREPPPPSPNRRFSWEDGA